MLWLPDMQEVPKDPIVSNELVNLSIKTKTNEDIKIEPPQQKRSKCKHVSTVHASSGSGFSDLF